MGNEVTRGDPVRAVRAGRRLRVAAAGTAAVLLGLAFFPRGATADTVGGDGPSVWQGEAVASGVQVAANEKGFILAEILNANLPDGDSVANSSNQDKARASTFYPGLAVSQGPSLLCTAGAPCPPGFPPAWPLTTYAQYPSQPRSSLGTGQQLGGSGAPMALVANSADARAEPAGTSTRATVSDVSIPGDASTQAAHLGFERRAARILGRPRLAATDAAGSSALVRVGSGLATTSVAVTRGAATSIADTVLHHVSILGGIVDITSIHARSTATTDGAGVTRAAGQLTVSGVTVAGQAATIDSSGVKVTPGPGIGGDQVRQLNQALQQALTAAGWRLQLLGVSEQHTSDAPRSSAQGLMLYTQADVSAVPMGSVVYSTVLLGTADSQASAEAAPAGAGPGLAVSLGGPAGGGPLAPAGGGAPAPDGSGVSPEGGGGGTAGGTASPLASGPRENAGSHGATPVQLASDGVAAHRTTVTYLIAALLVLALGLAAPRALPALAGSRRRTVTGPAP